MKQMIKKGLFMGFAMALCLTACAQAGKPQTDRELKGMGMVVVYALAPGATEKEGVKALTNAGNRLFGSAILDQRNPGESASGGGNMSFPRWVRVTWRENTTPGEYWTTGQVIGDYTVEVLSRIPAEIFEYVASGPGRVIVLRFRLKDDGVLLAWDVREKTPNGLGRVYKMHGGDFKDDVVFNGKVIEQGWQK